MPLWLVSSHSLKDLTSQLTEVEPRMPAFFPERYISNLNTSLSLYKHIASGVSNRAIEELKVEIVNRFSPMPDQAGYLLTITSLRRRAQNLGIRRLYGNDKGNFTEFSETSCVAPAYLISAATVRPRYLSIGWFDPTEISLQLRGSYGATRICRSTASGTAAAYFEYLNGTVALICEKGIRRYTI